MVCISVRRHIFTLYTIFVDGNAHARKSADSGGSFINDGISGGILAATVESASYQGGTISHSTEAQSRSGSKDPLKGRLFGAHATLYKQSIQEAKNFLQKTKRI